jgi:hypothetical protein
MCQVFNGILRKKSVSQMTTDMFHMSDTLPGPFLIHDLSPDK